MQIPSGLYLVDTSAIARVKYEPVHAELTRLGKSGLLATCVVVDTGLVDLPLIPKIAHRAREIQTLLAQRSQHRAAGGPDILTAAIAEHYGAIILHYDSDFDHISTVSGQQTRWIVQRGTVP